MRNFTIAIPPKMWRDGQYSKALIPLLVAYGPYMVDEYTAMPYVRLVPLGMALGYDLPSKKWIYENGEIRFEDCTTDTYAYKIV